MKDKQPTDRIQTGVRNFDAVLCGGLPRRSVTLFGGSPGAGKTILSQQVCFKNAMPDCRALFIQTLSEPTAKTLRYLKQFSYFDPKKLEDESVQFIDLGGIMRTKGLEQASAKLLESLKQISPAFVVIDSFKVFSDLAKSAEELRKFTYEVAIQLMAWECTAFLLGEFSPEELQRSPLSSIVDGIVILSTHEFSGEQQRFLQVMKMRGTNHDRDEHPFSISQKGIEVYAPRLEIKPRPQMPRIDTARRKTGLKNLDLLVQGGISVGSSVLVSGPTGTGKTVFCLETLYRGAKEYGEKGILFSFDESADELRANARSLGWNLDHEIKNGRLRIIHVPPAEILVERDLLMFRDTLEEFEAKRVAFDSLSAFLHKIKDTQILREKVTQLATLIRDAQAIGFFTVDVPSLSGQISSFGVEETLLDGIILLSSSERGTERDRYLEVYKLRNTNHRTGRHKMKIELDGITVLPTTKQKKSKKTTSR